MPDPPPQESRGAPALCDPRLGPELLSVKAKQSLLPCECARRPSYQPLPPRPRPSPHRLRWLRTIAVSVELHFNAIV